MRSYDFVLFLFSNFLFSNFLFSSCVVFLCALFRFFLYPFIFFICSKHDDVRVWIKIYYIARIWVHTKFWRWFDKFWAILFLKELDSIQDEVSSQFKLELPINAEHFSCLSLILQNFYLRPGMVFKYLVILSRSKILPDLCWIKAILFYLA